MCRNVACRAARASSKDSKRVGEAPSGDLKSDISRAVEAAFDFGAPSRPAGNRAAAGQQRTKRSAGLPPLNRRVEAEAAHFDFYDSHDVLSAGHTDADMEPLFGHSFGEESTAEASMRLDRRVQKSAVKPAQAKLAKSGRAVIAAGNSRSAKSTNPYAGLIQSMEAGMASSTSAGSQQPSSESPVQDQPHSTESNPVVKDFFSTPQTSEEATVGPSGGSTALGAPIKQKTIIEVDSKLARSVSSSDRATKANGKTGGNGRSSSSPQQGQTPSALPSGNGRAADDPFGASTSADEAASHTKHGSTSKRDAGDFSRTYARSAAPQQQQCGSRRGADHSLNASWSLEGAANRSRPQRSRGPDSARPAVVKGDLALPGGPQWQALRRHMRPRSQQPGLPKVDAIIMVEGKVAQSLGH